MPFDDTRKEGGGGDNSAEIAAVMFFLRGAAQEGLIFNSYRGRDAFDAFARLLNQDPVALWERTGRVG